MKQKLFKSASAEGASAKFWGKFSHFRAGGRDGAPGASRLDTPLILYYIVKPMISYQRRELHFIDGSLVGAEKVVK